MSAWGYRSRCWSRWRLARRRTERHAFAVDHAHVDVAVLPALVHGTRDPQSSAVVTRDGRVFVASEWARHPTDKVWLLTRRANDRIVRKVAGTIAVNAADVQYRYWSRTSPGKATKKTYRRPSQGPPRQSLPRRPATPFMEDRTFRQARGPRSMARQALPRDRAQRSQVPTEAESPTGGGNHPGRGLEQSLY